MKRFLAVLLALCLAVLTFIPAFAAEETDTVIDGTWKILVAGGDTAQANYAARKIQSVLAEALGTAPSLKALCLSLRDSDFSTKYTMLLCGFNFKK